MNDPLVGSPGMPYVSRGRRRRWVLAMYLCVAAVALWLAFGGDHWSVWLAVGPMVVAATMYLKLIVPIREALTEKVDRELDERQLAARNGAYFRVFKTLGVAVFGAVLYGALTLGSELPAPRTVSDFGILGILVAFLLGSLPASAAAWTEPDPEPEEWLPRPTDRPERLFPVGWLDEEGGILGPPRSPVFLRLPDDAVGAEFGPPLRYSP